MNAPLSSNPVLRGDKQCPHGYTKRAACWDCVNEDAVKAENEVDRLTARVAELEELTDRQSKHIVDVAYDNGRLRAALEKIAHSGDDAQPPHNCKGVQIARQALRPADEPSAP